VDTEGPEKDRKKEVAKDKDGKPVVATRTVKVVEKPEKK
jgi:hypothetical protein